ncbi:Chaperone protein HtpG [Planctomycetes bacterium Pan216]|uniref:Chaperone protein HtpG n=1 Tax=Kolteria novifilia TaxID=2527975 RepID=A0A518B701_9BACT|nr:Chaperone protein HtpG [Planctomycetes bacterium Pan216]
MSAAAGKEVYNFQAEITRLLHLLAHSLYESKEVALRELVSNASDALDKMRFVALTDASQRDGATLEIEIRRNEEGGELIIADNGVGMTHDEMIANLGTIAKSGSLEFLKGLTGDEKKDVSLIGQFGVGFYASFMIADKVRVRSRSYREKAGHEWVSDGSGSFSIEPVEAMERGTQVILHLKESAKELLDEHRLKRILKDYSGFVSHPIKMADAQINDVKPIWVEPRSQLTAEQYTGFYQHLTHRTNEEPMWHLHVSADTPIQFHALLYCPPSSIERMGLGRSEHGLQLCTKRVLVQRECRQLLPDYLRFLHGIVDSEDLPLNISRESLQDNTVFRKIGQVLLRKIFDKLETIAEEQPEEFLKFWQQFGPLMKEGIASDFEHRDRIIKLMRFASSRNDDPRQPTTLADYVERMPEDQKQIYYASGFTLDVVRNNPNLEVFKQRGLEVLYLLDPIDEFLVATMMNYNDKPFVSIDAANVELPGDEPKPADEPKADGEEPSKPAKPEGNFGKVLTLFEEILGERVKEVRESKRLTDSPCCLVNPEGGVSSHLEKLMKMANQEFPSMPRIFEVNPKAKLIERLTSLVGNPENETFIKECGRQLFDNCLILDGTPPDPHAMVDRVRTLMEEAAAGRSSIIQ